MTPNEMTVRQLRDELAAYGTNTKGMNREELIMGLNSKIRSGAEKLPGYRR